MQNDSRPHAMEPEGILKRPKFRFLLVLVICLVLLISSCAVFYYSQASQRHLAKDIAMLTDNGRTGFEVYYYLDAVPEGFELDTASIAAQSGLLVFRLLNNSSGKEIVITEQPTGSYDLTQLRGDKEFKTQYGQAFITDGQSRTTGALFTTDGTWVLLNAPNPIGADSMQALITKMQLVR